MNTFKKLFLLFALHLFIFSCSSSSNSSSSPSSYSWQIVSWGNCINKSQTLSYACKDSNGNVVPNLLCTSTPATSQSCTNYVSIPSDGNFTDTTNDIFNIVSETKLVKATTKNFIDLTNMFVNVSSSKIEVKFTVKEIPEQLPFNLSKLALNSYDYLWGISFDIDANDKDSLGDIRISAGHSKNTNTAQFNGNLKDNLNEVIAWETESDGLWTTLAADLNMNYRTFQVSGNTISITIDKTQLGTLAPKFANITNNTKVRFLASYDDGENNYGFADYYPNFNQ